METVTMVRIYLTEQEGLKDILKQLRDVERVRGFSVFRAISGVGPSGVEHKSTLVDPAMDLPVVIEFFEEPAKAAAIIAHLQGRVPPGHLVSWSAQTN